MRFRKFMCTIRQQCDMLHTLYFSVDLLVTFHVVMLYKYCMVVNIEVLDHEKYTKFILIPSLSFCFVKTSVANNEDLVFTR